MSHVARRFEFPDEQAAAERTARRLAWASIVFLVTASFGLFLTLGQSQAMKTAWVSDVLSIIPPAAWLVSRRYHLRAPSHRFPYGYHRATSVAFLVTAGVLTIMGVWLLVDAGMKLLRGERPPIGAMNFGGRQVWAGWVMIAALAYSLLGAMILGKMKEKVAPKFHDKVVATDAEMNAAEWMSEGAAILGIVLVGFGLWWGDAAAAAFISIEIVRDGWKNIHQVIADLMDESPSEMGSRELEELPKRVKEEAERLEWVERAGVRLRELGHLLSGEVFVVPKSEDRLLERLDEAGDRLRKLDWRLHELVVVPVRELEGEDPPRT